MSAAQTRRKRTAVTVIMEEGQQKFLVNNPCISNLYDKAQHEFVDENSVITKISETKFSIVTNVNAESVTNISVIFLDTRSAYVAMTGRVVGKQMLEEMVIRYDCQMQENNPKVIQYVRGLERRVKG